MLATPRLSPLAVLSLALAAASLACASSRQREAGCVVLRVADGDTFSCRDGRKVRLIGIDSPEREQPPFGGKAQQALRHMLPPGSAVRLEYDVAPTDQYGRVLAYVWLDSTLVNEAMIRDGWAVRYTVPPNVKYAYRLGQAQNEARTGSAGLWGQNGFACLPKDFRKRACLSSP